MGETVDALQNPVLWLAQLVLNSVIGMLRLVLRALLENTEPQIISADGGNFFLEQYTLMRGVALWVAVPLAIAGIINSMIKGGLKQLMNTVLVGIPVSVLGGVGALALIGVCQQIDNNIVDYFDDSAQANLQEYINRLDTLQAANNLAAIVIFGLLFGVGILFAGVGLMLELFVREVSIYTAALFIPLAFASFVWPKTRKWMWNLLEFVIAMIFAKAVVVAVISLGFGAMLNAMGGNGLSGEGGQLISSLAIGLMILFAAAFTMPVLVNMVLMPNNAPPLDRSGVQMANPLNSNRQFYRGEYARVGKTLLRRPGAAKNLTG